MNAGLARLFCLHYDLWDERIVGILMRKEEYDLWRFNTCSNRLLNARHGFFIGGKQQ